MGRPFIREISDIPHTVKATFSEPLPQSLIELVDQLSSFPLLVIGSGGSLSCAQFIAQVHEYKTGHIAKAATPLELMLSPIQPSEHAVLFITASGNNRDIIKAFEVAIRQEFRVIGIVCATEGSKLIAKANKYSTKVHCFEFSNPSGKDGFVAVNSLISTCIWMGRGYDVLDNSDEFVSYLFDSQNWFDTNTLNRILKRKTIVALGSGWAWPAIIDTESKFTEVGLANVLISDLRNFGHGRHNWFDKKGDESAILILEAPPLAKLTEKTLAYLPEKYPSMVLKSLFTGPLACIDLLSQVFLLVHEAGKSMLIDPGRPGVPSFGSKIYHLSFSPLSTSRSKSKIKKIWIERKARALNQQFMSLEKYLVDFLAGFKDLKYSGIVFDYDGTLCDHSERFLQPKQNIADALNDILSKGISVGIATGRGQSVQDSLRKVIREDQWGKVIVGNYNGSIISPLTKDLPESRKIPSDVINDVCKLIKDDLLVSKEADIDISSKQVSISPKSNMVKQSIYTRILELTSIIPSLKIVESGHSIDILESDISKLTIIKTMREIYSNTNILAIGDQGQYGGNDFEMLNIPQSLSVDKVSSSLQTCWNLSPAGLSGANATLALLRSFKISDGTFELDTYSLEKES